MTPFWLTAFLDLAPGAHETGGDFWRWATGHALSPARGEHGEFATLVPPGADGHLRVQRLGSGASRVHLDLHVASPPEAADRAVSLGAREVARPGHVVMASPGGLPFCFVTHPAARAAAVAEWPDGHRSAVDQVCIDVPGEHHDRELDFWQRLTGREPTPLPGHREFVRLTRPEGQPLHLLVQRLTEPLGETRAHLDVATTDRPAETARHRALGAGVLARYPEWTVLADPGGSAYCIIDREPQ